MAKLSYWRKGVWQAVIAALWLAEISRSNSLWLADMSVTGRREPAGPPRDSCQWCEEDSLEWGVVSRVHLGLSFPHACKAVTFVDMLNGLHHDVWYVIYRRKISFAIRLVCMKISWYMRLEVSCTVGEWMNEFSVRCLT